MSFVPSADEASEFQDRVLGAPLGSQVVPESLEVKIGPYPAATASFVPSAEEATELQS
jgi:hypothetical protein